MLGIDMVWLECGECGAAFGMSRRLNEQRREDGKGFFCINGHQRVYRKSELDKAREELERSKREAEDKARELDRVRAQLATANSRAARFKCPHCTKDYATRAGVLKHEREAHKSPLRLAKDAGPDALNSKVS